MKLAKRISIALLAACVIGGSALAMTACGGGEGELADSAPPVAADAGVHSYLERSDVQAELKKHIAAVNTEGDMRLGVSAEGNNMVYTYTMWGVPEDVSADDFADTRLQLEASHSTFAALINEIETTTDAVNPNIVIRYESETGIVLYELTFTKTDVVQTVPAE